MIKAGNVGPNTRDGEMHHCPCCGARRPFAVVFKKWGYRIGRCGSCGVGRTLDAENVDIASIYDGDYFSGSARDGYADYEGSESVLRAEFAGLVQLLQRTGCRGGRLLEIGCAFGFFLMEARNHFECIGTELCREAVQKCNANGLSVSQKQVGEIIADQSVPFDVAVMLDVIEHLDDLESTFARLHDGLVENGTVLITTGDWGSLVAKMLGRHWRLMTPPQHLTYFTRQSLQELLRRFGFRIKHVHHPWKRVPVGLATYQVSRRLGMPWKPPESWHRLGVPVNLFDAMRVVAVKV